MEVRSDRARELKYGQTAPCMKDGGKITKQTVKEDSSMLMETSTMDSGKMIRLTGTVSIAISMEPDTKATGKKTSNMEKASKHGLMVPATKVITWKARSMVKVNSPGLMEALIMGNSLRITLTGSVSMNGQTEESSKESGKIIKWKEEEFSLGPTTGDTRENISMTRKKVKASSSGPMEESMKESGRTESNMVSVSTLQPQARPEKDNGLRARG